MRAVARELWTVGAAVVLQGLSRYGYDKVGRLSFAQDTWYGTRRFAYNTAGELIRSTNGVGGKTRFGYDTRARLISITDPVGGLTTRTYTATDDVASVTDPLGRVTTATYDPAGRQLSQTDPEGHTTTWTYDEGGRESSTSFDGKLLAAVDRDLIRRSVIITDYTAGDGLGVEHVLGFDRRGQLHGSGPEHAPTGVDHRISSSQSTHFCRTTLFKVGLRFSGTIAVSLY